jgi:tetratricopeptide (TPR) repeat protein
MNSISTSKGKKTKRESTYMDADFWYYKGVVLNQKGRKWYESALACYKQALQLDKDHTPSIFNIACNYEKLENYTEAKAQF